MVETIYKDKKILDLGSGIDKISGAIRKSILTNLTDNKRRSNSVLPRVHSD